MTMDKSLRIRRGLVRSRSVLRGPSGSPDSPKLTAGRKATARWACPRCGFIKLAMKKKKKKKEEEGEGAAPAADAKKK